MGRPSTDGSSASRGFTYEEIIARDKCSLDMFWLKDESLEDSSKLPEPHVLAAEIAEDLRSAVEQIESVLSDLQERAAIVDGNKIADGGDLGPVSSEKRHGVPITRSNKP